MCPFRMANEGTDPTLRSNRPARMPFPSTGCQTCKTRRVKCDEAQPVCQKCVKSKRVCSGRIAGEGFSVVHIENSYASGQKKRPRGPRSAPTSRMADNPHAGMQGTTTDLTTHATAYFVRYHLQTSKHAPDISKGLSDDVLSIWTPQGESPILDLAVSSMALAVFSQTQKHPPAAIEASVKYQQLLKVAQATIYSLTAVNLDACLLAIFFMSRYEDAIYLPSRLNPKSPFTTAVHSFSHHDGALAILRSWKFHLSRTHPPTDVVRHTRRCMIKSALLRSLAIPEWMREGSFFGESGLDLEYDRIVVRLANVRHETFTRLDSERRRLHSAPPGLTQELDEDAQDIDEALRRWAAHLPSDWQYERRTLSNSSLWPTIDVSCPVVYNCSSPVYAFVWNQYFAMRMLLNSSRLRIIDLGRPDLNDAAANEKSSECLANIDSMASDLASSLPFCLEKLEANTGSASSNRQDLITVNIDKTPEPYIANLTIWPLSVEKES